MSDIRVVLAEDHEVVRSGLKVLVNACEDMEVVGEARTGVEAIECAHALKPDVMIMDISMPEMDGATATARIVSEVPEVRVVALTAHEDFAHLSRLLEVGASGYVLKRAAADQLVRAIREVAAGGSYVDPTLAGGLLRQPPALRQPEAAGVALSEREAEVLRRTAWGESNKEIATSLGLSTKTVETYKARIRTKLQLHTRTEMVRYAVQRGWLSES